jgi:hypothetical protein
MSLLLLVLLPLKAEVESRVPLLLQTREKSGEYHADMSDTKPIHSETSYQHTTCGTDGYTR